MNGRMKKYAMLGMVKWLAGIFVAVFLIYQLYQLFYNPFTTSTTVYFETYEGIDTVAVAIRDEKIIEEGDVKGAKRYLVMDGEKVAKNGTIAEIYDTPEAATAKNRVDDLENRIERLTEIQSYNDLSAANLTTLDVKIRQELINVLAGDSDGKIDSSEAAQEMLYLINRRQIITGEVSNFNGVLTALNDEKKHLESTYNLTSASRITTDYSGYFVSSSDGYESTLTPENLENITGETIRNVIANSDGTDMGDKVISEYSWYLAVELSLSESLKLKAGDKITLRTNTDSNPELPVVVHSINRSADGSSVVVIFKSNYINGELAVMRTLPVTIVLKTYSGLKIPAESIRWVDGVSGVYKISGNNTVFIPVDIVYSTESYVVCKQDSESELKLYDEIIVKGKQLYDGKIIR